VRADQVEEALPEPRAEGEPDADRLRLLVRVAVWDLEEVAVLVAELLPLALARADRDSAPEDEAEGLAADLLPVDERDGDSEGADALGVALPELAADCVPDFVPSLLLVRVLLASPEEDGDCEVRALAELVREVKAEPEAVLLTVPLGVGAADTEIEADVVGLATETLPEEERVADEVLVNLAVADKVPDPEADCDAAPVRVATPVGVNNDESVMEAVPDEVAVEEGDEVDDADPDAELVEVLLEVAEAEADEEAEAVRLREGLPDDEPER